MIAAGSTADVVVVEVVGGLEAAVGDVDVAVDDDVKVEVSAGGFGGAGVVDGFEGVVEVDEEVAEDDGDVVVAADGGSTDVGGAGTALAPTLTMGIQSKVPLSAPETHHVPKVLRYRSPSNFISQWPSRSFLVTTPTLPKLRA